MKYFKNVNGAVRGVEDDGSQDSLVESGYTEILGSELELLLNPVATVPTAQQKRDLALLSLVHDFGDGRVIQVRPIDEGNLRNEIDRMSRKADEPQSWRMVDNTWHEVTVAELQTALESGQDQGRVVWDQFEADTV